MNLIAIHIFFLAVTGLAFGGEATKNEKRGINNLGHNSHSGYGGQGQQTVSYGNVDHSITINSGNSHETISVSQEEHPSESYSEHRQETNHHPGLHYGQRTNHESQSHHTGGNEGPRTVVTTVNEVIPVPVPQPYPVQVTRRVPIRVAQRVEIPVPRPVQVPILVPQPVEVPRPVPVTVTRRVPVAVPYTVRVPVHQAVRVSVPQPYPVTIPQPYPVRVPQTIVIPVAQPIFVGEENTQPQHPYNHYDHHNQISFNDHQNSFKPSYGPTPHSYTVSHGNYIRNEQSYSQLPPHTYVYNHPNKPQGLGHYTTVNHVNHGPSHHGYTASKNDFGSFGGKPGGLQGSYSIQNHENDFGHGQNGLTHEITIHDQSKDGRTYDSSFYGGYSQHHALPKSNRRHTTILYHNKSKQ